jgi:hypothetical protein
MPHIAAERVDIQTLDGLDDLEGASGASTQSSNHRGGTESVV